MRKLVPNCSIHKNGFASPEVGLWGEAATFSGSILWRWRVWRSLIPNLACGAQSGHFNSESKAAPFTELPRCHGYEWFLVLFFSSKFIQECGRISILLVLHARFWIIIGQTIVLGIGPCDKAELLLLLPSLSRTSRCFFLLGLLHTYWLGKRTRSTAHCHHRREQNVFVCVLSLPQWRCYRNFEPLVSHTNVHAGRGGSWRAFLKRFFLRWSSVLCTYWGQVYCHNASLVYE